MVEKEDGEKLAETLGMAAAPLYNYPSIVNAMYITCLGPGHPFWGLSSVISLSSAAAFVQGFLLL
jgi:hypothetical protein